MCSNCKYLDAKDKKDGKVNGCMYYCKKNKKYCCSCALCEFYEKDEKREKEEVKEIERDLDECDNMTVGSGILMLTFFVILFIVTKLT